jgi:tetratricopeptide (TPR) repeat protein
MEQPLRFFVSFSSRDLKFVREIMAALQGQNINFWDYSDIIQSIEAGETIDDRLKKEIDNCTHMIAVISENSMHPSVGRFCRFEMEYAQKRNSLNELQLIPVITGSADIQKLKPPYDIFEKAFCQKLDDSPETIVKFTAKICQLLGKIYVPPIIAHPNLPFWKLFRKEIEEMAHSNREHVDIMMILGEFNENYRKAEMERALFLITYFLTTCEYRIHNYKPFYPLIVKAVCETELGMFDDAMKSYENAKSIHPENQDIIGGMGTVYFKTGQYPKAAECFEKIIRENSTEDITNARINLIITKQSMGEQITNDEEDFLFDVNIDPYPDDLKTAILNAQAIQLRLKRDYTALEKRCKTIIDKDLHDTITIRLLQLSYLNRGMIEAARQVIINALKEAENNPRLDKQTLKNFEES